MELAVLRDDMVDGLEYDAKGVLETPRLSAAMRTVPRHEFVPDEAAEAAAYEDRAFTHRGTTVLAPSVAARLLEALAPEPDEEVLVVGAGVGYTAAVLAEVVGPRRVAAIDIDRGLVYDARANLEAAGYGAVLVDCREASEGLPGYAPYDRILVEAAAVEPPRALRDQLAPDGRIVMPHGMRDQHLAAFGPDASEPIERFGPVRFKPLLVEGEQPGTLERDRTAREDRERAERAAKRRKGWEQDWIDWDGRLENR